MSPATTKLCNAWAATTPARYKARDAMEAHIQTVSIAEREAFVADMARMLAESRTEST